MGSSINTLIARGLPAIDPAGDYAKLSDLALEAQQRRLEIQQQQQLLPLKMQAAQQLAQENALKVQQTQRAQRSQDRIMEISQDPTLEGNPDKILPRLIGDPNIDPDSYWKYAGNVTKSHKDRTDQAKSASDLAIAHQAHRSSLAAGALDNPSPMAIGGYLHQNVTDGSMTDQEAKDIEFQHRTAPDPDAWARQYLQNEIAKNTAVQTGVTAAAEGKLKQDTEKRAADRAQAVDESYGLQNDADVAAWKTKHPQYATIIGDTFKPDTPGMIRLRLGVPVKDQPALEQAQATTAADTARTPADWTKLITAAVEPEWVPAVQALVDAEPNPTKKRAIIQQIGLQKPGAEDSLAREATNILAKPVDQRTPQEKARLKAIQQQTTMFRAQPAAPGVTVMVPNAQGGYTVTRATAGQTVGPGAVTPTQMGTLNVPTSQTRTMAETAPRVLELSKRMRTLLDENETQLGPLASRWDEFTAGKVGLKNRGYTQLRTDAMLLQTALMRMHVGARGSGQMMEHFKSLIDASIQNPDNLRAALDEIEQYANSVKLEGGPKGAQAPAGGGAAGTPITGGKKGDPLGIR